MIDPKNNVVLTFGVVADPEVINDNILKLRGAVDYAGSEKGASNTSGYFDIVYYMNNDDNARNAKFVRDQIKSENFKKGSQLSLVGRLVQERWSSGESKGQKVVIVAESLTYAGNASKPKGDGATAAGSVTTSADVPDVF